MDPCKALQEYLLPGGIMHSYYALEDAAWHIKSNLECAICLDLKSARAFLDLVDIESSRPKRSRCQQDSATKAFVDFKYKDLVDFMRVAFYYCAGRLRPAGRRGLLLVGPLHPTIVGRPFTVTPN